MRLSATAICVALYFFVFASAVPVPADVDTGISSAINQGKSLGNQTVLSTSPNSIQRRAGKKCKSKGTTAKTTGSKAPSTKKTRSTELFSHLLRRDSTPIGYTGVLSNVGNEWTSSGKVSKTSSSGVRLGNGLYLTDSFALAETFAHLRAKEDRSKTGKAMVCVISASNWAATPKVWFPESDKYIHVHSTSPQEENRVKAAKDHGISTSFVRFAKYKGNPGNEMNIPADLQGALTAKCVEVVLSMDSDDEGCVPEGLTELGFTFDSKKTEWNIKEVTA